MYNIYFFNLEYLTDRRRLLYDRVGSVQQLCLPWWFLGTRHCVKVSFLSSVFATVTEMLEFEECHRARSTLCSSRPTATWCIPPTASSRPGRALAGGSGSSSWLPYSADSYDLDLSGVFHNKYQWKIWKNTTGKSSRGRHRHSQLEK